jgi:hypothetical protein
VPQLSPDVLPAIDLPTVDAAPIVDSVRQAAEGLTEASGAAVSGALDSLTKVTVDATSATTSALEGFGPAASVELQKAQASFERLATKPILPPKWEIPPIFAYQKGYGEVVAGMAKDALVDFSEYVASGELSKKADEVSQSIGQVTEQVKKHNELALSTKVDFAVPLTEATSALQSKTAELLQTAIPVDAAVPVIEDTLKGLKDKVSEVSEFATEVDVDKLRNDIGEQITKSTVDFLGGDEYWRDGRGREVLSDLERWKADPSVVVDSVAKPVNDFVENVRGYWTQGRGKEALKEIASVVAPDAL